MDAENFKHFEQAVTNSRPLKPRSPKQPPSILSAKFISMQTVEPLDSKVIGDCEYEVRIKPCPSDRRLLLILYETELSSGRKTAVPVRVPIITNWREPWLTAAAAAVADGYRESNNTIHVEPPDQAIIRQLLVGRAELYKRGYCMQKRGRN